MMWEVNKPKKKGCMKWIYSHIRHRIPYLVVLMLSNIIGSYSAVIFSLSMREVIDSASSGTMALLIKSCVILGSIIIVRVVCGTLSLHLLERLNADFDRDFKKSLIHKILHSEFSAISGYHSGDLVNRLNGDVRNTYTGVLTILSSLTSYVTSLVTAVCVLLGLAPMFTVAIVCISIVIALLTLMIQRQMKELHKQGSSANGKVSGFYQEIIEKLLIVQALDVSDEIEKRSDNLLEDRWQIQRRRKNISLTKNVGSNALSFIGGFVTLIWCAVKLLHGEITFGELSAMTALVSQLQTPMLMLPSIIPKFISVFAASERLMEIEDIASQSAPSDDDPMELYAVMQEISAHNLTFAYDRNPIMKEASFSIPKGGLTVIVGASGIGKSTLLKLLLGIYNPVSGELAVRTPYGYIPVSRATRSLFSYAPQGNLLLSGTLRDNLLISHPNASEEEIKRALYVSAMNEYISSLPDGLDTNLGENGAGLSEGQAQRLSLARAVLSDAPILLLDEVTSALDAKTEATVLERICALPDKTCIAVTHRPAALELADYKLTVTEKSITLSELKH